MDEGLELLATAINNTQEENNSLAPETAESSELDRLLDAVLELEDIISEALPSQRSQQRYVAVSDNPTVSDIIGYQGNLHSIVPAGFIMLHNDLTGTLGGSLKNVLQGYLGKKDESSGDSDDSGGLGLSRITNLLTTLFGTGPLFGAAGSLLTTFAGVAVGTVVAGSLIYAITHAIKESKEFNNETVTTGTDAEGNPVDVTRGEAKDVSGVVYDENFWALMKSRFFGENFQLETWDEFAEEKGIVDKTGYSLLVDYINHELSNEVLDKVKSQTEQNKLQASASRNPMVRAEADKYDYDAALEGFKTEIRDALLSENLSNRELLENLLKSDQIATATGGYNIASEILEYFGIVNQGPGGVLSLASGVDEGFASAVVSALKSSLDIYIPHNNPEKQASLEFEDEINQAEAQRVAAEEAREVAEATRKKESIDNLYETYLSLRQQPLNGSAFGLPSTAGGPTFDSILKSVASEAFSEGVNEEIASENREVAAAIAEGNEQMRSTVKEGLPVIMSEESVNNIVQGIAGVISMGMAFRGGGANKAAYSLAIDDRMMF